MDDEDSKIRRNLVTASAVVLLLVWLKLPLADVAERLLGAKASGTLQVDAIRIWSAVVAVLIYFALRFVFSEAVEKGGDTIRLASISSRAGVIEAVVRWELFLFNRFKKESPVFNDELESMLAKESEEMRQELGRHPAGQVAGVHLGKAKVSLREFQDSTKQWSGAIYVLLHWETEKKGTARSIGSSVDWHIGGYRRWLVVAVAILRVVLLSKVGISLLYPLALFAVAFVASLVMLWKAF
jgi:hypothetical protein